MTDGPIIVEHLVVDVATGSDDPYNQGGWSSISARVETADPDVIEAMTHARDGRLPLTLRCARLDVAGRITNVTKKGDAVEFVLSVDDLVYREARPLYEVVRRRIRRT